MSRPNGKAAAPEADIDGKCFHCGDRCTSEDITAQGHSFCCHGCKSVYELLSSCGMDSYYTYADNPGIKQLKAPSNESFAYLDAPAVQEKLLDFRSDDLHKVRFRIPAIHCASCIWLIENFQKLVPGVLTSRVNFSKREARFSYDPSELSLRRLAEQLAAIGYEPELEVENDSAKRTSKQARRLIHQIGVAGFCFGNIMLLSLPEYLHSGSAPDERYRFFFGMVNLALSLPVLLFSAKDFLT
jgi:Cu+-exporting ATPase